MENYVYHYELMNDYTWGKDVIMIETDINLLKNTDFDDTGYKNIKMDDYNIFIRKFITSEIEKILNRKINIEKYHSELTEEEHNKILHNMPYKKNHSEDMNAFCRYLEKHISNILNESVKIFNDDIWIRICRPTNISDSDFNPCHKDVYLDFYRNTVNIYLPICGSNEKSSLLIQSGSHKWNENQTIVTSGGAYFKKTNKKYSVDAVVASKTQLEMIRPNPKIDEILLFSPYLIHGCSSNDNLDLTRMSLEIRFIKDNSDGKIQEESFRDFLSKRVWR